MIALAQYATAFTRSWAANSPIARVRLKAENGRLRQEMTLLTEEIRIKDARMKRVEPQKRLWVLKTSSAPRIAVSGMSASICD